MQPSLFLRSGDSMGKAAQDIGKIYDKVREGCMQALLNSSDDIQSTGRDAVREWRNKPGFGETIYNGFDRIEILIKPTGNRRVVEIFQYVDLGTKRHMIFPKVPGTMLKFRGNYSARTQPVAKYNVGSGQSFGSWMSKAFVQHPGNKARLFLETFAEKLIPNLQVRVQTEITKAIV